MKKENPNNQDPKIKFCNKEKIHNDENFHLDLYTYITHTHTESLLDANKLYARVLNTK